MQRAVHLSRVGTLRSNEHVAYHCSHHHIPLVVIQDPVDTAHCRFRYTEPQILEQRFLPCARFTMEVLSEAQVIRDRYCEAQPSAVLVVIPAEIPVLASVTNTDHFVQERTRPTIIALAVVAEGDMMHSVSMFYFKWFPQPFPVRVFGDETEALDWLRQRLPSS